MEVEGLGIDHVADADHRGGGQGRFVDGAEDEAVVVGVDDTRRDVFSPTVNHERRRGRVGLRAQVCAERLDFAALDQQVGIPNSALRPAGPEGRPFNQNSRRFGQRTASFQGRARKPFFSQVPRLPLARGLLLLVGLGCKRVLLPGRLGCS